MFTHDPSAGQWDFVATKLQCRACSCAHAMACVAISFSPTRRALPAHARGRPDRNTTCRASWSWPRCSGRSCAAWPRRRCTRTRPPRGTRPTGRQSGSAATPRAAATCRCAMKDWCGSPMSRSCTRSDAARPALTSIVLQSLHAKRCICGQASLSMERPGLQRPNRARFTSHSVCNILTA